MLFKKVLLAPVKAIILLLHPFYRLIMRARQRWSAYVRRQRSVRAMHRLDDYLLDDIGFYRQGDKLLPLGTAQHANSVRNNRRKSRFRCVVLLRRRRRRLRV